MDRPSVPSKESSEEKPLFTLSSFIANSQKPTEGFAKTLDESLVFSLSLW